MMNENQYPNVAEVRATARATWEQRASKHLSLTDRVDQTVSWWLVAIALVFFLLSAPHTARVFNMLTPWLGYVAPIGVEFGLLFVAYHRKQSQVARVKVSATIWTLAGLLFATSIIVNGAGSFVAVVDANKTLQDLSLSALLGRFGGLPAQSQVALVLVPIAALIIPIGTVVAGEGLAALFLERKQTGGLLDERWQLVSAEVEYLALRDAAISQGIPPGKAARWASQISGYGKPATRSATSETHVTPETPRRAETRRNVSTGMDRNAVREHLIAYPEDQELGPRPLARALDVSITTAFRALQDVKHSQNGNGGEHD
jgi:hypothetical protein